MELKEYEMCWFYDSQYFTFDVVYKDLTWEECMKLNEDDPSGPYYFPENQNLWFVIKGYEGRVYYSVPLKYAVDREWNVDFVVIVAENESEEWARKLNNIQSKIEDRMRDAYDSNCVDRIFIAGEVELCLLCEQRPASPDHDN